MGLNSILTLRASSRGWLGGGGCFLAPSAMAAAESLVVGAEIPSYSQVGTTKFSLACEYCQGSPRGETLGSELVGRW